MRLLSTTLLSLSLAAASLAARAQAGMFPWVLPWDDSTASVTDVSAWLDKPAGAHGFVTARDGHLYAGSKRLRLLGTNITSSAAFPEHADADKVAARLAKFGINCVRFHHMDAPWARPNVFSPDGLSLSPEQLDRLDYFIAQLKKHGIYADLNLHVSREYPGMPRYEGMTEYFKGLDNFYPPMVAMQRDYARALLTHMNRYTRARYVDEPAVAIIEINNENGLSSQWHWGSLDRMAPVYADELKRQWNAWLAKRYADDAAMKSAWGIKETPLGAEMLTNGDFGAGQEGWNLELNGAAKATAAVGIGRDGKPALGIDVTAIDGEGWHVQLSHPGLKLAQGQVYTLEFDARAGNALQMGVDARQAHAPWETLWSASATLSDRWQHFSFPISPSASEDVARVTFSNLGARTGAVQLAGVSLRPGGGFKLKPGEALGTIPIVKHAEYGSLNAAMQADWSRFLYETESGYWKGMAGFIRGDLGARSLIVGTPTGFSPAPMQAQFDVVDGHAYWQHPSFSGQPWDSNNWFIPNTPMAGRPDGGTLPGLGLSRVVGKPFIVTEYDHPAPATRASEGLLLLAGYGGLQDWDGMFSFAYEADRSLWRETRITGYFDIEHHPTKMATMPAVAALFLRGDLASPAGGDYASTTPDQAIVQVARFGPSLNAGNLGVATSSALQRPVGLRTDGKPARMGAAPAGPRIASANGQWVWDSTPGREHVEIDAPRSRALIGSTKAGAVTLGDVTIAPAGNSQDWAAITLTAMDGADLSSRGRILITATGNVENTGMRWKSAAKTTVGQDWGAGPTLVEGIPATITLAVAPARLAVWALDERGQRRAEVPVTGGAGKATFTIGPAYRTLWYEAVIR